MSDASEITDQTAREHPDQTGENLDADKLPDEYPERPVAAMEYGTTVNEQRSGEPLEDRLARERPTRDHAGPGTADTPLVADAGIDGADEVKDLVSEVPVGEPRADDSGHPDAPAPAERDAVREVDPDGVPGAVDRQPVRRDR